jgi:hypothetical protein
MHVNKEYINRTELKRINVHKSYEFLCSLLMSHWLSLCVYVGRIDRIDYESFFHAIIISSDIIIIIYMHIVEGIRIMN